MKTLFVTAALSCLVLSLPAAAEDMAACNDENMKKTEMDLKAMTDPAMKDKMEMGMKELEMAMMASKEKKDKDCMMHLDAAMKAAKGG